MRAINAVLPRAIEAQTKESIKRAKDARETEQAEAIARILAIMHGYEDLDNQPQHIRKHFAKWGFISVRGSAFDAGQFRALVTASRVAAQAAEDCAARIERYEAVSLTDPQYAAAACYWNQVSQSVVGKYLDELGKDHGGPTFTLTDAHFLTEVANGDPRRI